MLIDVVINELRELDLGRRWLSIAKGQFVFSPRVPVVTESDAMPTDAAVVVVEISDLIEALEFKQKCVEIKPTMSSCRPAQGPIPAKEGIEFVPPFSDNKPPGMMRVSYYAKLEPYPRDHLPSAENREKDPDSEHHRKDFLNVGD
jgi:hypothetical protein